MPILHPAQPSGASFPTAGCSSRSPRGRQPGRGPADRPQRPPHPMLRTVQQRPPGLRTPRSSVRALSPSPRAPGSPPGSTARSEAPSPPFHPMAPCRGRAAPHGARTATGPAEPRGAPRPPPSAAAKPPPPAPFPSLPAVGAGSGLSLGPGPYRSAAAAAAAPGGGR